MRKQGERLPGGKKSPLWGRLAAALLCLCLLFTLLPATALAAAPSGQVLYAGAYDHQISQIIFHGKKNTYVYDTTDIRLHTKSYLKFYENIPVPLQGMEADDYEIYVVYQNEFYDLEQNIKIK